MSNHSHPAGSIGNWNIGTFKARLRKHVGQSSLSVTGDVSASGDVYVLGSISGSNNLAIGGNLHISGTLNKVYTSGGGHVSSSGDVYTLGSISGSNNLAIGGNAEITGSIAASGSIVAQGAVSANGFGSSQVILTPTLIPSEYNCLLYGPVTLRDKGTLQIGADSVVIVRSFMDFTGSL